MGESHGGARGRDKDRDACECQWSVVNLIGAELRCSIRYIDTVKRSEKGSQRSQERRSPAQESKIQQSRQRADERGYFERRVVERQIGNEAYGKTRWTR